MKFPKKIFTSVLSFALLANTFIMPASTVQAAPADDGLIDGVYYGVSSSDIPGWHGAWGDWKLGPLTINYSQAQFSIRNAAELDKSKQDGDEAVVFTCPATTDNKAMYFKLPVNAEMEKGDIYTFSADLYVDIGAGGATTNIIEAGLTTTTSGVSGLKAQYIDNGEKRNSGNVFRDFGSGAICFASSSDWHSWADFAKKFVRYEIIVDTEDEEYNGQQTIEVNIRNTDYPAKKQHFKALYNQVDANNSNAVLSGTVDKINEIIIKMNSNPSKLPDAPIVFAFDNVRSSVYHGAKGERDALLLKAKNGECTTKTFTTMPNGTATAASAVSDTETITFNVPENETAVAYRDVTRNGATMNLKSYQDSAYVYADVLVPEGESASDYYITLASMPQKVNDNVGNAVGIPLSNYYTTPGEMQRVEIPLSEFVANGVELCNGGAEYDKNAELIFLSGIGVARKTGEGAIEIGDMYIVCDVEAPTDLIDVDVRSGQVTLNWTPSPNTMTEYEIYRDGELIDTVDGNVTEYTDTGLENDSYYSYKVRGKCLYGKYTDYATVDDIYVPAIGVPENVVFQNAGGSELAVNCSWEAPAFGEPSGYIIYRDGEVIAELDGATNTYKDEDIEPNTTYKYEICATMEGYQPSYKVSGEVFAAYVLKPENLAYNNGTFTWSAPDFAASYKVYVDGREFDTSDTNLLTLSEPLPKNDIHTVEVTALTAEGNESLKSAHIRVYEKKAELETVRDYYNDDVVGTVKINTDYASYDTISGPEAGYGEKSLDVNFEAIRKSAIMFRGAALGDSISTASGVILVGMYIPENTNLQNLQVGLSYVPSVASAKAAYSVVPIADYVKETGRWTVVEVPVSVLPKNVEFLANNQTRPLEFDIKKATDVCIVGDYVTSDNVADILVDEVMIGKYVASESNLVNKDGVPFDGYNLTNDETAIAITTSAGFNENALSNSNASVKVLDVDGNEVPAITVLDQNNVPKIVLASRLDENGTYTVKISGITDANGAEVREDISFNAVNGRLMTWAGEGIDVFDVTTDTARTNSSFKAYVSVKDIAVSSDKFNKIKVVLSTTGNASINKDTKASDLTLADCLANAEVSYSESDKKLTVTADVTGALNCDKPIITIPVKANSIGSASVKAEGRVYNVSLTRSAEPEIGIDITEASEGVTVKDSESTGNSNSGVISKPNNDKWDASGTQFGGQRPSDAITTPTIPVKLSFSDVTAEHWAYNYIDKLIDKRVLNGYDDGTFRPSQSVTRAEFVTMLKSAFRLVGDGSASFDDVTDDAWYKEAVDAAASLGIVSGMGDGTFAPNAEISRQDMCTILKNVIDYKKLALDKVYDPSDFSDADEIADYAKEAISFLKETGVIDGYDNGDFGPRDAVTRAAAAKVIALLIG